MTSTTIQITVHRLNGQNFLEWSQSVKLAIDGRGKLGYLTGEAAKPDETESTYKTWRSENSLVMAWLLNSMDPSIARPHMFMKTAKDVWDSVKETYSDSENSSQIFELKAKLWNLKQGDHEVTIYYNEMAALWQELDQHYDDVWDSKDDYARQKKREENDWVYMFLAGMNQNLDEVKGRILGRKPLPSIREVFSEIRQEESRKKVMHSQAKNNIGSMSDNSALVSRNPDTTPNAYRKKKPWCDHCQKAWHTRETCWKLHGKPPGWKKRSEKALQTVTEISQETPINSGQLPFTQDQIDQLVRLLRTSNPTPSSSNCSVAQNGKPATVSLMCSKPKCTWVIDSGATDHMTGSSSFFSSYKPCAGNRRVRIADGSFNSIARIGDIKLSLTITLSNVLHVPKLSCNLISISKLTQDLKCQAKFSNSNCVFQEVDSGKMIGNAREYGGLYFLDGEIESCKVSQAFSGLETTSIDLNNEGEISEDDGGGLGFLSPNSGPNNQGVISIELTSKNKDTIPGLHEDLVVIPASPKIVGNIDHINVDHSKISHNKGSSPTSLSIPQSSPIDTGSTQRGKFYEHVYQRRVPHQGGKDIISQLDHESNSEPSSEGKFPTPLDLPIALRKERRSCAKYPISNYVSYSRLSPQFSMFSGNVSSVHIPRNIQEALESPEWKKAVHEELGALEKNQTWVLEELPVGKSTVGCKWVFTPKFNAERILERYKARLVAKGFTQTYGIDYSETFAPVAMMNTVQVLLSIAVNLDWPLQQLDVKNAFLNGMLEEEVFMDPPPGFEGTCGKKVCRLKKALYGLKQSPRAWFGRFTQFVLKQGYVQGQSDHTMFTKFSESRVSVLIVYVDDIILTGDDIEEMRLLKEKLSKEFEIKDLGGLRYFLAMEFARSSKGLAVSQRKYIMDLLKETGMSDCKPAETPIDANKKLGETTTQNAADVHQYQRLVGKLIYLSHTRPDIAFAVSLVSQFMHAPSRDHLEAVNKILRYLKGCPGKGLCFKKSESKKLEVYTDADWAGSITDRKSTSGYCTFLWGNLVTWRSKKQNVVARSSAEAEFRAMANGICEAIWVQRLLQDMRIEAALPIRLYCDNKAAISIAHNPVQHDRTKHFEVD
ncbi:uncharacterized protein [Primulina eburnea]|uniref:uncharacterized protein n=1 Tax=Primulina eburnea TaxID=1245227 RepID=UPI003C6C03F0